MKEKILYYIILPFAVVFFCIFGLVANAYALEKGEIQTNTINGGRFYHSFLNENNGTYSFSQNGSNKYGYYDWNSKKVYGLSNGINGMNQKYLFYGIPISSNNESYEKDLSIHFKFSYQYYSSNKNTYENFIPFMAYNFHNLVNDSETFNAAKDLILFGGELSEKVEIDSTMFKTEYSFFYYPRVAQTCTEYTNTSDTYYGSTICDVTFNFPQNYFDNIPLNEIYFGFYNNNDSLLDTNFGNGKFRVFDEYSFWYDEPYEVEKPSPTSNPQEEQLQTSKGIFGTLKNVLISILDLPGKIASAILDGIQAILEPLFNIVSDLLDGLINLFKSLFVPSDDYFQNFFDKLLEFIQKKLGFLAYPFTWLIDIMQYYLNLSDTKNYVLSWNDIIVPNFNHVIIHSGTFNLSTALADSNVKMAYDIYLAFVDTIIFLAFLKLCKNKYAQIVGGEKDDYEYVSVSDGYNVDPNTGKVLTERHTIRRTTRERRK